MWVRECLVQALDCIIAFEPIFALGLHPSTGPLLPKAQSKEGSRSDLNHMSGLAGRSQASFPHLRGFWLRCAPTCKSLRSAANPCLTTCTQLRKAHPGHQTSMRVRQAPRRMLSASFIMSIPLVRLNMLRQCSGWQPACLCSDTPPPRHSA